VAYLEMAQALLDAGAGVNVRDAKGRTPQKLARKQKGAKKIDALLEEHGGGGERIEKPSIQMHLSMPGQIRGNCAFLCRPVPAAAFAILDRTGSKEDVRSGPGSGGD
jgi:hypothetical protein